MGLWEHMDLTMTEIVYKRLSEPLKAAGVPVYQNYAPSPVEDSLEPFYVTILQHDSGWAQDSYHAGIRHKRCVINIYARNSTDENGLPVRADAKDIADAIFNLINSLMHFQTSATWPDVVSCRREEEPTFVTIPNHPDIAMLHSRWEVAL